MQMVACDFAISPMPNSTSSFHWFLPLVMLCTLCPERQTPHTFLSDFIIPLPHSCYSHYTWLLLHGDSEPWSFQFFLIQLFNDTPSKLPVLAQWHITVLVVQLSPMEKNNTIMQFGIITIPHIVDSEWSFWTIAPSLLSPIQSPSRLLNVAL